jgi:hypothetical protein
MSDELRLDDESRRILGKGTQRLADHAKRIESEIDSVIVSESWEASNKNLIALAEQTKQLAICIRAIAEFFS